MITNEGIYTHAIFGFINMIEKIKKDYEPSYMLIAFDMKAPTFRHKAYEEYKAGRKKMPPELAMQIPLLKAVLDALKISRTEFEGFEADDIIGTVARKAEALGLEPIIVTGDRDQLQLATDITKIIYTKRGVTDFDLYDHDSFCQAYGFEPLQLIDYKGLAGDSSDNIPGIPGIGDKTATKLIQQYGSVENIIRDVDTVKPAGLKKKVEDNAQLAMLSKKLATINVNVPMDIDIEEYKIEDPDYDKLIELYTKLEFNRFLSKLSKSGVSNSVKAEPMAEIEIICDVDKLTETIISDEDGLKSISITGDTAIKVFGDNSHVDKPVIDGIALINNENFYYIKGEAVAKAGEWLDELDISFVGHDLIDDYFMLMSLGAQKLDTSFDTAIAQYVLDSGRSNYDITALANEYLHISIESEKDILAANCQISLFDDNSAAFAEYGKKLCAASLNMAQIQKAKISDEGLTEVLYEIELPLIKVMAGMEKEGFKADSGYLTEFGQVLSEEIDKLAASVHEMAGEEFNINSPIQLGDILFEKLQLPHGKKTKRGYSTSAEVLEKIKNDHPIVPAVLEYRTLSKLKSTYIDGLIPLINSQDGKIHAHFQQTVAATGRLSCTEPNLQNIPIRQELGRKLRKAFVPESEECVLLGADYSQIELRVLAHMSGDQVLIDAFNNGEDIHRATAANVLGVPEDQITLEERSRAKAVNFGVIYGMSAFGLSTELHITRKDAENYISTYFLKHAAVKKFMDDSVEFCKANGYVTTIMGRKRFIKEIKASQYMVRQVGERLAMNTPVQGSAADIIKIAMIKVDKALRENNLKSRLILQIHDELIINTYPYEKEIVKKLLVENMESALEMKVDLKAELNEGVNWYDLK